MGQIAYDRIRECSGIIASRQYPGILWTHNDKGNAAVLYAIRATGELVGEYRLAAKNSDWEDIAVDDAGNLYIAATGNNELQRKHLEVYRLAEPDPRSEEERRRIKDLEVWELAFPGDRFDCESLFVFGGKGYLISKRPNGVPAELYAFPLVKSKKPVVLERISEMPVRSPVTAADVSADGRQLAILSWDGLYCFDIDGDLARVAQVTPARTELPRLQFEACCFTPGGILVAAESREIYLVPLTR